MCLYCLSAVLWAGFSVVSLTMNDCAGRFDCPTNHAANDQCGIFNYSLILLPSEQLPNLALTHP